MQPNIGRFRSSIRGGAGLFAFLLLATAVACADAPSSPEGTESPEVKVTVALDSALQRATIPIVDNTLILPAQLASPQVPTGGLPPENSRLPLEWSREAISTLSSGTVMSDRLTGRHLEIGAGVDGSGLRLRYREHGIERMTLELDFTSAGASSLLRSLRADVRDEAGRRRALSTWSVPAPKSGRRLTRDEATAMAQSLARAADTLDEGPCSKEQRDVLLATAGLVFATAIGNPGGVFLGTFKVASAVYSMASCFEAERDQ